MLKRPVLLAALAAFAAAGIGAAAQQRPPDADDPNSGSHLYREFCASCHGAGGKGDGPAAPTLTRRATDLTQLSRRNAGTFPREMVRAVLEATEPSAGHAEAMPNWRRMFERLERGNERAVRARVEALVTHVESMQVPR